MSIFLVTRTPRSWFLRLRLAPGTGPVVRVASWSTGFFGRRTGSDGRSTPAGELVSSLLSHWTVFKPVCEVSREAFGAASLERPVILPTNFGWRLYLSCATPNSKHRWIDALDAERPEELPFGDHHPRLAGGADWAVKDPVIIRDHEGWRMWVCCHPLADQGHEDRMITRYATSVDGLHWQDHDAVLRGTPGSWDARGARITAILDHDPLTVLYDGRATAAENQVLVDLLLNEAFDNADKNDDTVEGEQQADDPTLGAAHAKALRVATKHPAEHPVQGVAIRHRLTGTPARTRAVSALGERNDDGEDKEDKCRATQNYREVAPEESTRLVRESSGSSEGVPTTKTDGATASC
jgi:hypothetical protein